MEKDLRVYALKHNDENWNNSFRNRVLVANESSKRTRKVTYLVALLSFGLSLAMFSYFFSWNKNFAFQYVDELHKYELLLSIGKDLNRDSIISNNLVRENVIKEWLSTQTWDLPIIGLKIMASDLPLFAPLAFIIITTILYFSVRREHYTIGRLLGDVYFVYNKKIKKRNPKAIIICQEIYHLLIGQTVYNVIPYDSPIKDLSEALKSSKDINRKKLQITVRQIVIQFLVLSPIISITFISATRLGSFFCFKSAITGNIHHFEKMPMFRQTLLILALISTVLGIIICLLNSIKIMKLFKSTRRLLDEYQIWAFQGTEPQ